MLARLKESLLTSKIGTISSYVWFCTTIAFTVIIFLSTNFITIDPSYSPGGAENRYLIPMLSSFFISGSAFGIMILAVIIRMVVKAPLWNPPLGLSIGRMTFATFSMVIIATVYVVGALKGGIGFGGGYTGQDVFSTVNEHRVKIGVKEVRLNKYLCDNLVERWKMAKTGRYHEGFDEWVKSEGIMDQGFKEIGEILVTSPTPREAVYYWTTSPGHRETMESTHWTDGCAYAAEGTTVMVFGMK